jgi:hypothetical protein
LSKIHFLLVSLLDSLQENSTIINTRTSPAGCIISHPEYSLEETTPYRQKNYSLILTDFPPSATLTLINLNMSIGGESQCSNETSDHDYLEIRATGRKSVVCAGYTGFGDRWEITPGEDNHVRLYLTTLDETAESRRGFILKYIGKAIVQ